MNIQEFLDELFLLYPGGTNENNVSRWLEHYANELPKNTDFDKLLWMVFQKHYSTTQIPPLSKLLVWAANCELSYSKPRAVINVEEWKKEEQQNPADFEAFKKQLNPVFNQVIKGK